MISRRRFHRLVFTLAGSYNLGWGVLAAVSPNWFFNFVGLEPLNHPEIFACLGMVVGIYGLLYLEVARRPEHGWLLAAVGLLGKVLGPAGALVLILRGTWPPSGLVLCLTNDFVWWVPFGLYLWDAWPSFRETLHDRTPRQV
jgi:hypothetical protein